MQIVSRASGSSKFYNARGVQLRADYLDWVDVVVVEEKTRLRIPMPWIFEWRDG
jgi:hypothetical protein